MNQQSIAARHQPALLENTVSITLHGAIKHCHMTC